ncbi:hypothetical protein [Fodinicola acaciae]|uniref:hypothetical protein n=1 Tax=Fodinicola acaciae TaxID=2681555 RepID=UPI0013D4E4F0|nr:hypothetical protein [Fodinicola acaciae]
MVVGDANEELIAHVRARIVGLGSAIEDVDAEQKLTVYRGWQCGMDIEELADLTHTTAGAVEDVIDHYSRDENVPDFAEDNRFDIFLWHNRQAMAR